MIRFAPIVTFDEQRLVVRCRGDEDRSTQSLRRAPLSRALMASGSVTVHMAELAFADSSLMLDLTMLARRLRKGGRELTVRDPQPQILRLIELVGLHRLPGVVVESVGAPDGRWALTAQDIRPSPVG
ncbi:MAG: STAS domain-containing protein [Actinobacteria bacterium]|nr:MAG: STAS domain-containing protein [Actinomycetota bacterium]